MADKLAIHQVDSDKKNFKDITNEFGDIENLSASALAAKLSDFAKKKNLDVSSLVAESV